MGKMPVGDLVGWYAQRDRQRERERERERRIYICTCTPPNESNKGYHRSTHPLSPPTMKPDTK